MKNETEIHTDCFAFNESEDTRQQCCALTERICNNKECHFYRNWDECDNITKQLILEQKNIFNK